MLYNDPWYVYVHALLVFTKRKLMFSKTIFQEANQRSLRREKFSRYSVAQGLYDVED